MALYSNRRENNKIFINKILIPIVFYCFLFQTAYAQNKFWFSNQPPTNKQEYAPAGMHKLSSVKGKRGQSSIIQWLRNGSSPLLSKYVQLNNQDKFEFYLFSPSGNEIKSEFKTDEEYTHLSFQGKEEGFYNGYLITKYVSNDTLYQNIAKAELLNHSCRNGHKNVRKKIGPYAYPQTIPAEIIRKRNSKEDFHFFISSGDIVDYQLIINNQAIEGAEMYLTTQTDWQKKLLTNKEGICTFQFIQDYFTLWQELNNRKIYYYVIFAEKTIPSSGIYMQTPYSFIHYSTSLSDGYRPAKTMYLSMFWALIIFTITVLVSVTGILIYKISRNRIYKEASFDEKN